jgi:hypothetical protein
LLCGMCVSSMPSPKFDNESAHSSSPAESERIMGKEQTIGWKTRRLWWFCWW